MLVRDNNGRHYPLSFYAPMSLHSFPSDNEAAYIRLYPVLDALSLLFCSLKIWVPPTHSSTQATRFWMRKAFLLRPGNGSVRLFRLRTSKSLKLCRLFCSGRQDNPAVRKCLDESAASSLPGSELECRKAYADAGLELTSGPVVLKTISD